MRKKSLVTVPIQKWSGEEGRGNLLVGAWQHDIPVGSPRGSLSSLLTLATEGREVRPMLLSQLLLSIFIGYTWHSSTHHRCFINKL